MSCLCNIRGCCKCSRLVETTDVSLANGVLTLTLPDQTYVNGNSYCVHVTQSIPSGADSNTIVKILVNGISYVLLTRGGHLTYADQIKNNFTYVISPKQDSVAFMYVGRCPLPTTLHVFQNIN